MYGRYKVGLRHDHAGMAIKPPDSHEHYRHRRRNERGRLHDCRRVSAHFVRPSALVKATEGSPRSQVVTHSNQDNEQNNTDRGENEGQSISVGGPFRRAMD